MAGSTIQPRTAVKKNIFDTLSYPNEDNPQNLKPNPTFYKTKQKHYYQSKQTKKPDTFQAFAFLGQNPLGLFMIQSYKCTAVLVGQPITKKNKQTKNQMLQGRGSKEHGKEELNCYGVWSPASMTLQLCPALPPHSWKVSLSHWASDLLQTWAQGTFLRKKEILLSSQKSYTRDIKGQTVWWQSWQIIELRWCQWLGIGSVKFASLEKSLAKIFPFFFFWIKYYESLISAYANYSQECI